MTWTQMPRHTAIVGAGYALGLAAALGALGPSRIYDGQSFTARAIVFLLLPMTATVILSVTANLHRGRLPHQSDGPADAALAGVLLWVVIFLIGMHAVMVGVMAGADWLQPWASRAIVVLFGVTVMNVGNLLPRTRPNMALGIRTARTIVDRQLWILTHRVSGYLAVGVGAVIVYAGLLLPGPRVAGISGIAFLLSSVVVTATYWRASHTDGHHRTPPH